MVWIKVDIKNSYIHSSNVNRVFTHCVPSTMDAKESDEQNRHHSYHHGVHSMKRRISKKTKNKKRVIQITNDSINYSKNRFKEKW